MLNKKKSLRIRRETLGNILQVLDKSSSMTKNCFYTIASDKASNLAIFSSCQLLQEIKNINFCIISSFDSLEIVFPIYEC